MKVGANESNSWSAYNQDTLEMGGLQFHRVDGSWTVPTATQHNMGAAEFSASWVGIGGGCVDAGCKVADAVLIQAGTSHDVDASGATSCSAWWEIIAEPSTPIPSFAGPAGDDRRDAAGQLVDHPPEQHDWPDNAAVDPLHVVVRDAEWIEETLVVISDSGALTIGPLPKLSTVNFDLSLTNGNNAGLSASEAIQLVDSHRAPLATLDTRARSPRQAAPRRSGLPDRSRGTLFLRRSRPRPTATPTASTAARLPPRA